MPFSLVTAYCTVSQSLHCFSIIPAGAPRFLLFFVPMFVSHNWQHFRISLLHLLVRGNPPHTSSVFLHLFTFALNAFLSDYNGYLV